MSYGCKVYIDRPLVCRLYAVGRAVDEDMNSFFFLTKTANYCQLGRGKEYTIEGWLEEGEVEPYFQWNDRFNSLFMEMDHKKYKSLELPYKFAFGEMLYDMDGLAKGISVGPASSRTLSSDIVLEIGYTAAKQFVKKFVK